MQKDDKNNLQWKVILPYFPPYFMKWAEKKKYPGLFTRPVGANVFSWDYVMA